jgi:hypothetical protein
MSAGLGNLNSKGDPVNLTPSQKGSFLAGVGLWVLIWASVWRADDIAEAMRIQRWFNFTRCLRWIGRHKSTTLLGTELVNYSARGLDPLGVSFSLGGTLVNVLVIYLLLPCLEKLLRQEGTISATLQ